MPALAEIQRIYPQALRLARSGQKSRAVLRRAVDELNRIDPKRALHTRGVVGSMMSFLRGEHHLFAETLDPGIKKSECAELGLPFNNYGSVYQRTIKNIVAVRERIKPADRNILDLAAWAHDLGVPFGIEWEHQQEGCEVINHLFPSSPLSKKVGQLVLLHGFHMDLTKSRLPSDIEALPENLRHALFILDFCDSVSRIKNGEISNPIGLEGARYFLGLSKPKGVEGLKNPEKLFETRFCFGFAAPIHNASLTNQDLYAMFLQARMRNITSEELVDFYGARFRCHFFNLLLSSLPSSEERGFILVSVYQSYKKAGMAGEVLLWPDTDLGRRLQTDLEGFTTDYSAFVAKQGFPSLIEAEPEKRQIRFFASKL